MTVEKRGGGPKTAKGKARSSVNAKTHGLSSIAPSDAKESALVERYSKELTDYYEPESPLEKLQIERIAICRAKLNYLYELERIKLALASKEFESEPEKILEKITGFSELAKGMAKECITEGQINLPCRLNLALLEDICDEINGLAGVIENQYQFARAMPKLTKYLNSYPVVGLNNTDQWIEKLAEVVKNIERIFDLGVRYSGRWSEIMEGYLLGKEYEAKLKKDSRQLEENELDQYLEERRIARGGKSQPKESADQVDKTFILDDAALRSQLDKFTALLKGYRQAERVVPEYQELKALMLRSVSMPAAESDLLMRYQTTLERRLSSAIGELLALQRSHR